MQLSAKPQRPPTQIVVQLLF